MAGVNKVIIIGNLGKDPEMRTMPGGRPVANISIATSETWKDKQTGEKREETEWHRVVLFDRLADIAGEYLRKGSKVYVEGKLKTRKWQDQQTGQDRYATDIVGLNIQMLDSRQSSNQQNTQQAASYGQQQQGGYGAPQAQRQSYGQQQQAAPQPAPQQQSTQQSWGAPPPAPPAPTGEFTPDDIPF